jgi:hypothetical protein
MMRLITIIVMLLVPAFAAHSQPRAGDVYEIVRVSDSETSSDELTGTTHDKDTIVERVIAVSANGLELEYDFPASAAPQERASHWQLPVRVFKPLDGPARLSNRAELESRVDGWLKSAELTRAACGRWLFTWNAFQIECNPEAVLRMLEAFDLNSDDLRQGALYKAEKALAAAPIRQMPAGSSGGQVFTVEMKVDPDAVRRQRAEADVVVAEISGQKLTLDAALRARVAEQVSGSIVVTFEANSAGVLQRRRTVTALETKRADGSRETQKIVETLERRPIALHGPAPA